MKGLKYISGLLLFSFFILVGHNLVPHHHHVASSTHPSSRECPPGDHEPDKENSCHAFNDIEFLKDKPSQLPLPNGQSLYACNTNSAEKQFLDARNARLLCLFYKAPPLAPELAGCLSMRGPPPMARYL